MCVLQAIFFQLCWNNTCFGFVLSVVDRFKDSVSVFAFRIELASVLRSLLYIYGSLNWFLAFLLFMVYWSLLLCWGALLPYSVFYIDILDLLIDWMVILLSTTFIFSLTSIPLIDPFWLLFYILVKLGFICMQFRLDFN